jgi:hypothetical protein
MNKRSYKTSTAAYPDIARVLETAKANGGLVARFESEGKAINFTQRCYRYRTALRAQIDESNGPIPGLKVETPYDDMKLSYIEKEDPKKRVSKTVEISFYGNMMPTEIIDPATGKPIDLIESESETETGSFIEDIADV